MAANSSSWAVLTAGWQQDLTIQQNYAAHRASSADVTGGNADARTVAPGETLTVLNTDGPGTIAHIWFTIADREPYHLKRIVLRMYWDGEATPSVEAPETSLAWGWASIATGNLNCFFPMPFALHARNTVTNASKEADWNSLLQSGLPHLCSSIATGHDLLPSGMSAGAAKPWLDG